MKKNVRFLTMSAVIAALYVVLTVLPPFNAISSGQIQFRISEALMAICVLTPAGIAGVTIGCFISSLLVPPIELINIVLGTAATFLAGVILYKWRKLFEKKKWLFPLPVTLINGLVVGSYLPFILMDKVNLNVVVLTILSVAAGEAVVTYILGIPLLSALAKHKEKLF